MPITLYRRHMKACPVHDSKLSAKAKRHYMDCECPLWLYGRSGNNLVPRQSTGTSDLKEAEAIRKAAMDKGKQEVVHGPRIADCGQKYLESRAHELSDKTRGQYDLLLRRLEAYCVTRGIYFMRELTVDLLETFKVEGLPDLKDTSKAKAVEKLRCFLVDAYRRKWVAEPLSAQVAPHHAVYEQKKPYTEEEIALILAEALKLNGGTIGYAGHPATFRLLLELMLETGMRVGDAVRFNPSALTKLKTLADGKPLWEYTLRPQKQKKAAPTKYVEVYLTDGLKRAIDKCKWLSASRPFFYGDSKNPAHLGNEVGERMKTIGVRCGVEDCRPHRLRDTFAVRKLQAGVPMDDVSKLLGHSSIAITEKYYAYWTKGRKTRLEQVFAQSLTPPSKHEA